MSIKNNTTSLQNLLEIVNNLPDVNEGESGVELPALTNEGSASDLILGKELIDANGSKVTGTFTIDSELNAQDSLITQIQTALQGKAAGGNDSGGANIETCIGTIDIVGIFTDEPEIYFLNKDLTLQHLDISFMDDGKKIEVVKNSIIYIKYVYPSGDENIVVLKGDLNNIEACYVLNDFTMLFSS